jgi:hypothetical protein
VRRSYKMPVCNRLHATCDTRHALLEVFDKSNDDVFAEQPLWVEERASTCQWLELKLAW